MEPSSLEIQNALRILALVMKGRTFKIEGDLVFVDGQFVGRTQEASCLLEGK